MSQAQSPIPQIILDAVALVLQVPGVQIVHGPSQRVIAGPGMFEAKFLLPVPAPNPENLPSSVKIRFEFDDLFPLTPVVIFSEDMNVRGFPHQEAVTHKICAYPDHAAPRDVARLKVYVEWTIDWLAHAAHQTLLAKRDPYELPDFGRLESAPKPAMEIVLLSDEDSSTFGPWKGRIGQTGTVELAMNLYGTGIYPCKFLDDRGGLIRQQHYSNYVINGHRAMRAAWLLLPHGTYFRHRPAQTYGELRKACQSSGIDLTRHLKDAWSETNSNPKMAGLLVGFPIPNRIGDPLSEIHWQPIWFAGCMSGSQTLPKRPGKRTSRNFTLGLEKSIFGDDRAIPWGNTENIARDRLYARGAHIEIVENGPIALAGCGALGAPIAEAIARGGVQSLALFDRDLFQMGNQCRHTLDAGALGQFKATALAGRLAGSNPLSEIVGFPAIVPLAGGELDPMALQVLRKARLIIDCTTDDAAFEWLDQLAEQTNARLVTIFINYGATVLTLCTSGTKTRARRVLDQLCLDITKGVTPVTRQEHGGEGLSKGNLIIPGAGCWHATFPATNTQMSLLASGAVEVLEAILHDGPKPYGTGVLLRQNREFTRGKGSLVEVVWRKAYR